MTRVGKLLVFLNLFASVGLATWAVSLSANRLDWVDRQDGEKKVEGDITRLKKEIDSSLKGIAEVSAVYGQQDRALTAAESGTDAQREGRDPRRKAFATRLKAAEDGRFAEQVRLPNKVLIDVSQESRKPVLGPSGQPLEGVEVYQKKLDDALKDSQTYLKKIADAVQRPDGRDGRGPGYQSREQADRRPAGNLGQPDRRAAVLGGRAGQLGRGVADAPHPATATGTADPTGRGQARLLRDER